MLQVSPATGNSHAKDGSSTAVNLSEDALLSDESNGENWPAFGRTYGEQHFSPLTEINAGTVAGLRLAWYRDLDPGNPVTIPVEVNGTIYFSSGLSVVQAVDALTGKLLWRYDSQAGERGGLEMRASWGIRGIAYWKGKVYTGTMDGRLIAIDANTGKQLWSVQTTRKGDGLFISGAPRAFEGKILIGQGGADSTLNRGYVTSYDAETGAKLWRFYVVPGNPANGFEDAAMAMAAGTWTGEWWKWGGGGEPWNDFTYDAETDTILIGTGNGFPWNQRIRSPGGGDNLFLCSMVALDATTGKYKWHYQFNPGESWDYNAAMDMQLAALTIDGQQRKVVMTAPKNGFFYVIDRTNGKLISAEKIAKVTWATSIDIKSGRPVEVPGARFPDGQDFEMWPGNVGAHSWMPMAYSPATRLVYIPKLESGIVYNDRGIDVEHWEHAPGTVGQAFGTGVNDPLQHTSALLAWDPVAAKEAWKVATVGGWNGGVLATAGNLVFQGQLNGRFSAYEADNGKELWHTSAQAAVLAAPITYAVGGHQYITVFAGIGTSASIDVRMLGGLTFDNRSQQRRMLTFRLGGSAKLPHAPPPYVLLPPPDPDYRSDAAQVARGNMLFGAYCLACHGYNAEAGGGGPDLRASTVPLSAQAFRNIVHDGALRNRNMPPFGELTEQDLSALRQYLRFRAAELRAGQDGHR
jgi:quinohemoprotein ethanol dehydrogenase